MKQTWMRGDLLSLLTERREAKGRDVNKYKELDKVIRKKCKEAKDEWYNSECDRIEDKLLRNPSSAHKVIKQLTGQTYCSSSGCIKAKDGTVIMEKVKIMKRWEESIGDLFYATRGEKPTINKAIEGPPILKGEIREALNTMKCGKAAGPDNITSEMLMAIEEVGIDKLCSLLNV